jgi:hypothetical protein
MTLMLTADLVKDRFLQLVQSHNGIIDLSYSEEGWLLSITPDNEEVALEKLTDLVRIACGLCPLTWIELNGERISVDTIGRIDESIYMPAEVGADLSLQQEKRAILTEFCKALIYELTRDRTVFVLSRDGIYLECHYQRGIDPLIQPEQMLNRSLHEVIGKEPADIVLAAIRKAIAKQSVVSCEYWITFQCGERRQYQAAIYPNSVSGLHVLASVKRIQ